MRPTPRTSAQPTLETVENIRGQPAEHFKTGPADLISVPRGRQDGTISGNTVDLSPSNFYLSDFDLLYRAVLCVCADDGGAADAVPDPKFEV